VNLRSIRLYVPDIECDSCVKLITRILKKKEGVDSFSIESDAVVVDFDVEKTSEKSLIETIERLQFRASTEPFERKSFKERWRHFKENTHQYKIEKQIFTNTLWIFFILFVLEGALYLFTLKNIPDFISTYGWWILYLNISITTITAAVWHVYTYRTKITCMVGMMIGMTFGMQTGMMLGAIIGATNGFFMGAMVGMLLGSTIGAITGTCCGIMGIMEGIMAGIMGGTMGSMIAVMMLSDHILIFMPFYMVLNIIIVWGLSYMLYEEVVEGKHGVTRDPIDFTTVCCFSIISTFILLMIMLHGPKSLIVFG
jgi:copper chaperone CopZ